MDTVNLVFKQKKLSYFPKNLSDIKGTFVVFIIYKKKSPETSAICNNIQIYS